MLRNVNVSHNLRDDLSPEMRERFLNKIINPSMSKLMTKKIKQQMGRKSPSLKRSIGNSSALLPPAHHVRHNRDLEIPDIKDNYSPPVNVQVQRKLHHKPILGAHLLIEV